MKDGARGAPRQGKPGPADPLLVIDRLVLEGVRLERRRLVADYAVEAGGRVERTELTYRFEEDAFAPEEPASQNLAAMIAAQVALNYGPFCRELVFRGAFDAADRKFLAEFAENTAREIWVNKLLKPNPFLTGAAAALPQVALERYCQAELVFPDEPPQAAAPWPTERSRYAVLSSGGKDSLLSFGLLGELGHEVHPIFLNESGRHWYTALNAYRHFAEHHQQTARVWTSSDRFFSWMLRQLPFVRQDFARVRSDAYPVRLWTLAVFLFGALPLVRRRGIGRIVIGNEYDTSVRATHEGIPHYAGLYDQSRWFDNAMSRYFRRKGWGLAQFSLLRPLSELLIEKILVERYPELQRLQMSCHATHVEDGVVKPCGACEKCRRIVGMLMALGAEPGRQGYTPEQVARCLASLATEGVHQELAGAEQMAWLLAERGLLPRDGPLAPRRHDEVLAMRFDRERSPWDAMPADLRPGVWGLVLEHATGAVERRGRAWLPVEPLSGEGLSRPYPFEAASPAAAASEATPSPLVFGELSWPVAAKRLKEVDVALLPVGAIEQHGPHLPLDIDAWDADYLARRVAAACSEPRPLVLPLLSYGVSYHHEDFPGTISVSPETQARLVYEIGMGAARNGITKLVIVNGHGGNAAALHLAAQMINKDAHVFVCVDTGETSDADIEEMIGGANDVHAGEIETSTALATRPELVNMQKAPSSVPRFSSRFLDFSARGSVGWYAYTHKISSSGVMGDATRATREKGERIWRVMTQRLVELVEDLKRLSLDEIYQKRY